MAETAAEAPFTIEEIHGWSLVQVAGWRGSSSEIDPALRVGFGVVPGTKAGAIAVAGSTTLIRVGPGRVWVVDDAGFPATALADLIGPEIGCLTPLGEGRCRWRLTGRRTPDVLAKLVALDLDRSATPPGRAALTAMHRVPVLLHRLREDLFDLYAPRTFEAALIEVVEDAAAAFLSGRVS